MRRSVLRALCVLLLAFICAAAPWAQQRDRPSQALYVTGTALRQDRFILPEELAAQPEEAIGTFVQSRGAPGSETRSTVRGVRLARLIEEAGLTDAARGDWKNLLVTATATDGYRAQFTWVELANTSGGAGVLVLFERDGRALDAREGRLALIATGDLRLGARHVRNLLRIEVRAVAD